jgi:copper chaperone CopZ
MALALVLLLSAGAYAFDAQYKYIIPSMKTQADADKVTRIIKERPGIMEIDVYLDKHAVIIFFDDEELDDEKMQLRIPLKKAGYRVERFDILYEDPEKRN